MGNLTLSITQGGTLDFNNKVLSTAGSGSTTSGFLSITSTWNNLTLKGNGILDTKATGSGFTTVSTIEASQGSIYVL